VKLWFLLLVIFVLASLIAGMAEGGLNGSAVADGMSEGGL
jgi:hypothetical protein